MPARRGRDGVVDLAVSHYMPPGHGTIGTSPSRSRDDALSPEQRGAVDAASGSELAGRFGAWWEAWADPARDAARRRGNTIRALDGDERRRWARAAQPAVDRWLRGLEADGVAGAREIYAAARTAVDGWRE